MLTPGQIPPSCVVLEVGRSEWICACCDEPIRFVVKVRKYFVRLRDSDGTHHYHLDCYTRAENLTQVPVDMTTRGGTDEAVA